jgi:acyl-CoA synthetase (NDP forming)
MSGHMVSVEYDGSRHFYIANIADPDQARDAVLRRSGVANAQALAPLDDATLEHHQVPIAQVRPFVVTDLTGRPVSDK